jgi:hypothetical protein
MRPTFLLRRTYSTQSSIQEWISSTLAQGPSKHTDTLDALRASHLVRTLPTRQHLPLPVMRDGDELIKGGNMIYFQPETMLKDLGNDGSSTVSHNFAFLWSSFYFLSKFFATRFIDLIDGDEADEIGI